MARSLKMSWCARCSKLRRQSIWQARQCSAWYGTAYFLFFGPFFCTPRYVVVLYRSRTDMSPPLCPSRAFPHRPVAPNLLSACCRADAPRTNTRSPTFCTSVLNSGCRHLCTLTQPNNFTSCSRRTTVSTMASTLCL